MGSCGKNIPLETQFMLVESIEKYEGQSETQTIYTIFLPLIEGQFRAALQGNDKNELEICLESGDDAVKTNQGNFLVYVHAGTNPFEVINQGVKTVEKHLQTFCHREKKKLPAFLDWFGWCTWDAFYTDVTTEGVEDGLKRHDSSLIKTSTQAPPQTDSYIEELTKNIRKDLVSDMEAKLERKVNEEVDAKVNQKVQDNLAIVLKKLSEANPSLHIDLGQICATFSSDTVGDGTPVTSGTSS
ncbi:hypothetical protein POM88_008874 [Heracleum sosnowskyi]|uniref:Uncharacterized protein n=1 Tax=Heracleum sosnowskyi TaxID=360622 RepID=A0AAD8JAB6_9APIA|nr:hypothetical protein POM88_008874 [Heracleum sosnowskyi]